MTDLIIALDMDSVTYDLHTPWLAWLKQEHSIDLTVDKIVSWNWHEWLPCGERVYDFLALDDAFINCYPYPGAQDAIAEVHSWGVRQFFVSTIKTKTGAWQKQQAVARDFPYLANDVIITSHNKDVLRAAMLVDDGPHNLEAFGELGMTCKVPYKYNEHILADFTMTSWQQYPSIISGLIGDAYVSLRNI